MLDAAAVREIFTPTPSDLGGIEDSITYHQTRLTDLYRAAARMLAADGRTEAEIVRWLVDRGADENTARSIAARNEREAQ